MNLRIVFYPNEFDLKRGTILDRTEDGYELVTFNTNNGKMVPAGYKGFVYPYENLDEATIAMPKRGGMVDEKAFKRV